MEKINKNGLPEKMNTWVSQIIIGTVVMVLAAFILNRMGMTQDGLPLAGAQAGATSDPVTPPQEKEKFIDEKPTPIVEEKEPIPAEYGNTTATVGKFPFSSTRYLTSEDVDGLSKWELSVMRNEIFARNGYKFHKNKAIQNYFEQQPWYMNIAEKTADASYLMDHLLSKVEKENIKLIQQYEKTAD